MTELAEMPISNNLLCNYLSQLVNNLFKILPMRENNEKTSTIYIESLRMELLGCQGLIKALQYDSSYLTILSILQFLGDNPECPVSTVKREVFRAISICNKLQARFTSE